MKLYVWEGGGISDAYHNDGTLVVLAESAAQAREVVRSECSGTCDHRSPMGTYGCAWDGSDSAIDREPDRVIDIATPCVVAFNGGGYD